MRGIFLCSVVHNPVGVMNIYTTPWVPLGLFHWKAGDAAEPKHVLTGIARLGDALGPISFRVPMVIDIWSLGCVRGLHARTYVW